MPSGEANRSAVISGGRRPIQSSSRLIRPGTCRHQGWPETARHFSATAAAHSVQTSHRPPRQPIC